MLRDNKISPFLIDWQGGVAGNDHAIGVEGVLFLNVDGIDGEWKSKDPVGEAERIIGELQRLL